MSKHGDLPKSQPKRRAKEEVGGQPLPVIIENLTGLVASREMWPLYNGVFKGHSVLVMDPNDARALHSMGCFGHPTTNKFGVPDPKVFRRRQYETRQSWSSKREEPQHAAALHKSIDSSDSSDDESIEAPPPAPSSAAPQKRPWHETSRGSKRRRRGWFPQSDDWTSNSFELEQNEVNTDSKKYKEVEEVDEIILSDSDDSIDPVSFKPGDTNSDSPEKENKNPNKASDGVNTSSDKNKPSKTSSDPAVIDIIDEAPDIQILPESPEERNEVEIEEIRCETPESSSSSGDSEQTDGDIEIVNLDDVMTDDSSKIDSQIKNSVEDVQIDDSELKSEKSSENENIEEVPIKCTKDENSAPHSSDAQLPMAVEEESLPPSAPEMDTASPVVAPIVEPEKSTGLDQEAEKKVESQDEDDFRLHVSDSDDEMTESNKGQKSVGQNKNSDLGNEGQEEGDDDNYVVVKPVIQSEVSSLDNAKDTNGKETSKSSLESEKDKNCSETSESLPQCGVLAPEKDKENGENLSESTISLDLACKEDNVGVGDGHSVAMEVELPAGVENRCRSPKSPIMITPPNNSPTSANTSPVSPIIAEAVKVCEVPSNEGIEIVEVEDSGGPEPSSSGSHLPSEIVDPEGPGGVESTSDSALGTSSGSSSEMQSTEEADEVMVQQEETAVSSEVLNEWVDSEEEEEEEEEKEFVPITESNDYEAPDPELYECAVPRDSNLVISDSSDCEHTTKEDLIRKWNPQFMPATFSRCDESLSLLLEEAFFLSWSLRCLQIAAPESVLYRLLQHHVPAPAAAAPAGQEQRGQGAAAEMARGGERTEPLLVNLDRSSEEDDVVMLDADESPGPSSSAPQKSPPSEAPGPAEGSHSPQPGPSGLHSYHSVAHAFGLKQAGRSEVVLSPEISWQLFCETQENFPSRYVAYHHFRSLGYFVKSGLKFGGDFLLYEKSPSQVHALYLVQVVQGAAGAKLCWQELITLKRIAETTKKEVLLLLVLWPKGACSLHSVAEQQVQVREILLSRVKPLRLAQGAHQGAQGDSEEELTSDEDSE